MSSETDNSKELWNRAQEMMQRIENGEVKATKAQIDRLHNLLDGYEAYVDADTELKRGMVGLLYERQIYLSKLWLLEKLGVQNAWKHPLLIEVKDILYETNNDFDLVDFMGSQSQ